MQEALFRPRVWIKCRKNTEKDGIIVRLAFAQLPLKLATHGIPLKMFRSECGIEQGRYCLKEIHMEKDKSLEFNSGATAEDY